jgi:hypothetical protein
MRTNRSGIYTVDRVERATAANTYLGYNNYTSGFQTTRLGLTASGVAIGQSVSNLISSYYADIRASGDLLLSSTGPLINSSNLTLIANLGVSGRPCVDAPNQRAYLVNGNGLRAFDAATGTSIGTLALPTTASGDWAQNCVRWGPDGFAILGSDKIYVARWSATIPAALDQNNDGFSDAWAAANFGTLAVNPSADTDGDGVPDALEYFFATSPVQPTSAPWQFSATTAGGQTILHLIFPRRTGLAAGSYGYLIGHDLGAWSPPSNVTETILSTQTVGGTQTDTVDAAIVCPYPDYGFVRLKWTHP